MNEDLVSLKVSNGHKIILQIEKPEVGRTYFFFLYIKSELKEIKTKYPFRIIINIINDTQIKDEQLINRQILEKKETEEIENEEKKEMEKEEKEEKEEKKKRRKKKRRKRRKKKRKKRRKKKKNAKRKKNDLSVVKAEDLAQKK